MISFNPAQSSTDTSGMSGVLDSVGAPSQSRRLLWQLALVSPLLSCGLTKKQIDQRRSGNSQLTQDANGSVSHSPEAADLETLSTSTQQTIPGQGGDDPLNQDPSDPGVKDPPPVVDTHELTVSLGAQAPSELFTGDTLGIQWVGQSSRQDATVQVFLVGADQSCNHEDTIPISEQLPIGQGQFDWSVPPAFPKKSYRVCAQLLFQGGNFVSDQNLTVHLQGDNEEPAVAITSPSSTPDVVPRDQESFLVTWTAQDADDDAEVTLYQSSSPDGCDASLEGWEQLGKFPEATQEFAIEPRSMDPGTYYFCAMIQDLRHTNYHRSVGSLEINVPPTVSIDNLAYGASANTLQVDVTGRDPDSDATMTLYYRLNQTDLTPCEDPSDWQLFARPAESDCQVSATTSLAAGTIAGDYRVCVKIDDNVNPAVFQLSQGTFNVPSIVRPQIDETTQKTYVKSCASIIQRVDDVLIDDVRTVSTPEDFMGMISQRTYIIDQDITLPLGVRMGGLNRVRIIGNNKTIRFAQPLVKNGEDWALFENISLAHIKDLKLENIRIRSDKNVAALGLNGHFAALENITVDGAELEGSAVGGLIRNVKSTCARRIRVKNSTITGFQFVGGIFGSMTQWSETTIFDSHIEDTVNIYAKPPGQFAGHSFGGVVGYVTGGVITDVTSAARLGAHPSITNPALYPYNVGGITGYFGGTMSLVNEISDSQFTGNIERIAHSAGGITGRAFDHVLIKDVESTGTITLDHTEQTNIGGIVGYASYHAHLLRTHARGRIQSSSGAPDRGEQVGGLVGRAATVSIQQSKADVEILAKSAGGLIGILAGGNPAGNQVNDNLVTTQLTVENGSGLIHEIVHSGQCFVETNLSLATLTASSQAYGLSAIGDAPVASENFWNQTLNPASTSTFGVGKTAEQLQSLDPYGNWNRTIWAILNGQYPKLSWEP